MSFNPMMGSSSMMGGMRPPSMGGTFAAESEPYDQNYRGMMMPVRAPEYPPHSGFPSYAQQSSIALFNIGNDATNSLYVDGVPNDTHEREVSRIELI